MKKIKITGFYRNRDDRWGGLVCAHAVSIRPGFPGQRQCVELANQTKSIPPAKVNNIYTYSMCFVNC